MRGEPGPFNTLAPSPTLLMASTPQPMPMSMASAAMRPAIRWLACWAEPHWQSTVVAAASALGAGHLEAGHGDDLALDLVDAAAEGVDQGLTAGLLDVALDKGAGRAFLQVALGAEDLGEDPVDLDGDLAAVDLHGGGV